MENHGGFVTLDDLRDYKSGNSVLVSGDLDNYSIHSLYLPSFGPIVIQLVQLLVIGQIVLKVLKLYNCPNFTACLYK